VIEIRQLQKVAGGRTIMAIEHLEVRTGEVVAFVGPTDSGKSALLSLLTGETHPTAGTVQVAGLEPARQRKRLNHEIGVLFAENALYERLSARGNLTFHCRLRGLPAPRADEVLAQVGLADHADLPASRLSHGLARRLAFARAILHRPKVLLLVEPFAECNAASVALLARLIRHLADEKAAILILSSEVGRLIDLCQSVYMLEQGRVVQTYSPREGTRTDLPFKVPARLEDQVMLLNPTDILYASAEGGRVCLHTAEDRVFTHLTLAELEERLARSGFFRAHRGYLVNLQRVKAVIPYTRDSFTLILDDPSNTEIPLSKAAARELREFLGY